MGLRLPVQTTMKELWRPPKRGSIKIILDALFHVASNVFISGIIARNESGQIMGACTYPHLDVANAFLAEACVCERAITFAEEMTFQDVHFEGDSLTVIKKINSREEYKSVLRPVIQNIKDYKGNFDRATFCFVRRKANVAAYVLASKGRRYQEPMYWVEEAPEVVDRTVAEDWVKWLCGMEKLYFVLHEGHQSFFSLKSIVSISYSCVGSVFGEISSGFLLCCFGF